jgi:hypothetical protein
MEEHLTLPGYILGSSLCCQNPWKGGVCVFVRKDLYFSAINISHNCRDKDLEICAIELEAKSSKLIIFSLYRVPTGYFNQFVKKNLDDTLKDLYKPREELLIFRDIITDYLMETNRKNI